jgi:hypothetical protein
MGRLRQSFLNHSNGLIQPSRGKQTLRFFEIGNWCRFAGKR